MKIDGDTIQYECMAELGALLKMIEVYVADHPREKENESIRSFYNLIDCMEMSW